MTKQSKSLDLKKIEKGVQLIIDALGDNINKEGMKETPKRVALMYEEIFFWTLQRCEKEIKLIETKIRMR